MKKKIVASLTIALIVLGLFSAFAASPTGQAIWKKETPHTVFLTFDDGPDPVNTPKILDILKENKVKATFFVLGHKAEKNPAIIKRIKDEGHTLGNHTYSHINGTVSNEAIIQEEIDRTHRIIQNACGVNVTLFRPPFGNYDWRAFNVAQKLGYQIILWTFDLTDWDVHDPAQYLKTVKENLSGGAIILLHDGGPKREALIEALPQIIKLIKTRGFQLGNKF
ncbi:MAG: polysaccharide deacetylase family protein [Candidatus Saganbacteria bacterium]|nr:polysaccharide deacetylase family protein [Candidatus Saganbacteria bacterium]